VERTKILVVDDRIMYEEEDGSRYPLNPDETVSMNLFGFTPDFFQHIEDQFTLFIEKNLNNPKAELFIPLVVDQLIQKGVARMSVLQTPETWFGVTYQDDKPNVLKMIQSLVNNQTYPVKLWEE
jgi:hypothetical protein